MNDTDNAGSVTESQALERAALLLGQAGDRQALFGAVLSGVAQIAGADRAELLAISPGSGDFQLLASLGVTGLVENDGEIGAPPAVVQQALADGQMQFVDSASAMVPDVVVPLRYGGRALGVILASQRKRAVTQAERSALQALANLAATALEQARLVEALAANEQQRRDFVSLTTHELRVPLTSISGYTDLMLTGIAGALSERQEQFLRTVKRNAGRMTILIADLGELNRIEDGRRAFDMAGFPLKALIEDVLEEQATSLDGRGHQLSRNLPDGLPPVYADQEAVRRVLTRILDNAIRYTPEGGALAVAADYQEHNLQVSVSDNGIGMDQEDQARLFTPFFRSEAEAVREHTGWGLSLALARALVEAQGGALWCDSEVGAGSVFHLTLPAAGGATVPDERK